MYRPGAVVITGLRASLALKRITEMPQSPYFEIAHRLLLPTSRAWEQPTYCREVAAQLRVEGRADLAEQVEQAARGPEPWLGSSARV